MKTLLFILLVTFSTVSLAAHRHHHHAHYGYGYTNFFFVPGHVVERVSYPTNRGYVVDTYYPTVRYAPYRYRKAYTYYEPRRYNSYWWW